MNHQIIEINKNEATHGSAGNILARQVFVHSYTGVLDRYADDIITNRHADYKVIEINGVCDRNGPSLEDGTCCEVDNVHPQFFSVFARTNDGDSDCVADCEHYSQALQYAQELSDRFGWQIDDNFKKEMEGFLEKRTGVRGMPLDLVEPSMTLSTGRTVFRRKMSNGAKGAFFLDGPFSEVEYKEYTRRMGFFPLALN